MRERVVSSSYFVLSNSLSPNLLGGEGRVRGAVKGLVRSLRRRQTDAEARLWHHLRNQRRTCDIMEQGYRVLRYWDNEVLQNTSGVLESILICLNSTDLTPGPSPLVERGENSR